MTKFTQSELDRFIGRFDCTPGWTRWQRRRGGHDEDVLDIEVAGKDAAPVTLSIAKTGPGNYAAIGFDRWSLTRAEDLESLLEVLARMTPRRRHAQPEALEMTPA